MNTKINDSVFTENNEKVSLKRILYHFIKLLFKICPFYIITSIFLNIVTGCLPAVATIIWKQLLDGLAPSIFSGIFRLIPYIAGFAVLIGITNFSEIFSEIPETFVRNGINRAMYKKMHSKTFKLPLEYFESTTLYDIMNRAYSTFTYGSLLGIVFSISGFITSIVALVSVLIVFFALHPLLPLIIVISTIPELVVRLVAGKDIFEMEYNQSHLRRELDYYQRCLINRDFIKETLVWNLGSFFLSKWSSAVGQISEEERNVNVKLLGKKIIANFFKGLGFVGSIALAAILLARGSITAGSFGAVIALLGQIRISFEYFFMGGSDIVGELRELSQAFKYLNLKETRRKNENEIKLQKNIRLENVSFSYPLTGKNVLEDISMEVKQGEVIALVGLNGAGKTTLVKLLAGLFVPSSGKVLYDGTDISYSKYAVLYKNISAVFQDYNRYFLSLRENVCMSDISNMANDDLIKTVLNRVGFSGRLKSFKGGVDTALGKEYGGEDLSGGQWQKVALARGYFKECSLIILDEPTASLDPKMESAVFKNFKEMCLGKAGIIVTHRIGSACIADRIVVLKEGKIIESGTHNELMALKKEYHRLYTIQSNLYG